MKSQIEKSHEILVDFKNIEKLYLDGFEIIQEFEEGKSVHNRKLNTIVRDLHKYDTIGTRCMSFLIDCEYNGSLEIEEVHSNMQEVLIAIMNIKHKYNGLNFLIRQDLLKTIINLGHEINRCLENAKEESLVEVA